MIARYVEAKARTPRSSAWVTEPTRVNHDTIATRWRSSEVELPNPQELPADRTVCLCSQPVAALSGGNLGGGGRACLNALLLPRPELGERS